MSTHTVCFYGEIRKNIPDLSSNPPPSQVLCIAGKQDSSGIDRTGVYSKYLDTHNHIYPKIQTSTHDWLVICLSGAG